MRKISLVQVNFSVGPKEKNAYYLPYTVGLLWEFVKIKGLSSEWILDNVIWKRDPIDQTSILLSGSDCVIFSNYVWNKTYNYKLADRVKSISPNTLIIFGGPESPVTDSNIFKRYNFIDLVVKKEGELLLYDILKNFDKYPFFDYPGLLINRNGAAFDTGDSIRINDLNQIPSPYLNGFFDQIMLSNPNVEWNMTLETDRGCPYGCTFCDWGSLTYNKVRKFSIERIYSEIEWAGKNKISYISMTSANFGMFFERDNSIADKILEVQELYRFPYTFSTAWAKNQKKEVISIVKKLIDSPNGFNQGLTVSVQSLNPNVLNSIKRKNMDMSNIVSVFKECEDANVPVYTELILGLPCETLTSWKNNFYELFNAGNHNGITVFQAQLIENSEMNISQRSVYDIQYSTVYDYMEGNNNDGEIKEGVDIIISTRDLNYNDMLEAQVWSWFITTFHINGLSSYLARLLKKLFGFEYKDFYENLYNFINKDPWWKKELNDTRRYYDEWMQNGEVNHPLMEGVKILGWNLIYRTTSKINIDENYENTFDILKEYLESINLLDESILLQIIDFQKNYFVKYNDLNLYPKHMEYDYDFIGFLHNGTNLYKKTVVRFDFPDDKTMSKSQFIKYLYFFRRRNFGKSWISNV